VNTPNPTRQVTLVGEACAGCDFSRARSPYANELDRTLQSQMHDVTVRSHANGSGEHEGARNLVREKRAVRVIGCALQRQGASKDREVLGRSLISAQLTALQASRILRGCECEVAGIDRDNNGIVALFGKCTRERG
jgi:hypothetical protein